MSLWSFLYLWTTLLLYVIILKYLSWCCAAGVLLLFSLFGRAVDVNLLCGWLLFACLCTHASFCCLLVFVFISHFAAFCPFVTHTFCVVFVAFYFAFCTLCHLTAHFSLPFYTYWFIFARARISIFNICTVSCCLCHHPTLAFGLRCLFGWTSHTYTPLTLDARTHTHLPFLQTY